MMGYQQTWGWTMANINEYVDVNGKLCVDAFQTFELECVNNTNHTIMPLHNDEYIAHLPCAYVNGGGICDYCCMLPNMYGYCPSCDVFYKMSYDESIYMMVITQSKLMGGGQMD